MPRRIRNMPTLLSLGTPSRTIAFVIPEREEKNMEAKCQTATAELMSRLTKQASDFINFKDDVNTRKAAWGESTPSSHDSDLDHKSPNADKDHQPPKADKLGVTMDEGHFGTVGQSHSDTDCNMDCALKKAYEEACLLHAKLRADLENVRRSPLLKRYQRLRGAIKDAIADQSVQRLRQSARSGCTCSSRPDRELTRRPSRASTSSMASLSDTVQELAIVMRGAWAKMGALFRMMVPPAELPAPGKISTDKVGDAPKTTTTTTTALPRATPTAADHVRFRSRIILLHRHLEKMKRDYTESKRSKLVFRRYRAMKGMLTAVVEARLD